MTIVTKWEKLFNKNPHLYADTNYWVMMCSECSYSWLSDLDPDTDMQETKIHFDKNKVSCQGSHMLAIVHKNFRSKDVYDSDRQVDQSAATSDKESYTYSPATA